MKSKASFIHERSAGHTLLRDLVLVWVLGFHCLSTTGFSQQLNQSPPAPAAPDPSTQTDSTNLAATTSQTPVPAPGPAPTRGERIKEEWLIGLDMGRVLSQDPVHNYLIGYANGSPLTELSEFLLCWISGVGMHGWTLAKNGEIKFTHNPLFLQNNEFQELDTRGAWSLSGDILTLKMSQKFVVGKGAVRSEENSLVELKIEQCEHRITEDELQKWKAQRIASGGRLGSFQLSADGWNNAQKDQFDFYCVNHQSQIRTESRDVNGKITVSEGYQLDGKSRNLKHNGPPFFIGRAKLQTGSESESVIPAIPGPAVSAIAELAQDCERENVDKGNQANLSSKDPPIIRRQQIKLSINGRIYTAEVAINDVGSFYYDVATQTIHIGLLGNRTLDGGIVRYHAGVINEMATFITDANDGRFDGVMTDASGQPLSPLATEAFSDRLSVDYLAYRRSLLAPNPTSTPKNPLDQYLAPLEQTDRSLTESLLNPRSPGLNHETGYAAEQNRLNARAEVLTGADRLIREGRLDDALALFKMNRDIVSRAYYCKLLRTYEHYFPDKAQRMQK